MQTIVNRTARRSACAALLGTLTALLVTLLPPGASAQNAGNSAPTAAVIAARSAFTGQDVSLGVDATGTPPLTFQWFFNAVAMTNDTAQSQVVTITNLTIANTGTYSVTVSNAFGSVSSSNITLTVFQRPHPALNFGPYATPGVPAGIGAVSVPVYYAANGSETNLSFSIGFDPAVLTNAAFWPNQNSTICACTTINTGGTGEILPFPHPNRILPQSLAENTQVFEDRSQISTGRLGVRIVLPAGTTFEPDYTNRIGTVSFDLMPGATNPYAGQIRFTTAPTPAGFTPGIGEDTVPFTYPILPVFSSGTPALNRQSGLVEQTLDVTNPGELAGNVRVLAYGLGVDSRTNVIRLQNAIGSTIIGTNVVPVADLGAVGPGETRRFTLEYYVSDRRPTNVAPSLELRVVPAAVVTPSGTELAIHNYRFTDQVFLVEFPTRSGFRYYIQYAATVEGTNTPIFKTSLPPILGTGSYVQWLDNGAPKTDPIPSNGMRLYRLVETR